MTTFFSDLFSTGANTPLTSHTSDSGHTWALAKGPGSPQVFTASGGILANGVNSAIAAIARPDIISSTADTTVLATYHYETVSFSYVGVTARMSADGNSGYLAAYSKVAQKWAIWRLSSTATVTNSAELVGQSGTSVYANGNEPVVEFTVTGTGAAVTLKLTVNGTELINYVDTDALRVVNAGYTGVYFVVGFAAGSGMWITSLSANDGEAASASIAITTPINGKINQRSGTTGTVSVTGTYAGTPTTIEARLVLDGTSTPISGFDWATKVASPAGNAYTFSFSSVPQGGWYNVHVRHSNDTAVNATSSKVGVGALFVVDGQSNAWNWFATTAYAGDSSLTPDTKLRIAGIQPTAWDVPAAATMNGAIACGNALVTALGIPVGLIDGSWNGSGLTVSGNGGQWISGGSAGNAYTASAAAISAETSAIEGSVWIQGEADAGSSVTQSAYYTALGQLIALRRTAVSDANSPYVVAMLARDTSGTSTDAKRQAINLALDQKCGDANIYRVERYDLPLHTDGIHHTAAGYTAMGQRVARALLAAKGVVSTYRGPRIASVLKVSGTVFDVTLTHNNGTDFTPTSGITGWRVTDGGTPVTVSTAVRTAANTVRLTLASSPVALPVVQYEYGMAPDIAGVLKDNSALTLPLEFSLGVTASEVGATVSSVTVSPSTATVSGLASQTFTATVAGTGSPSQAVTWMSTYGGITSGGVFTAPASTGSNQTITVTATSVLDNTKSGTSTVTVPSVAVVGSPLSKLQYQDVVSDTSTSASTTSLTLDGLPPAGRRSFASVYPVGTNNIPVMIREQLGSDWMLCSCTLSAATTLQVDSIYSSSNSGAAPAFTTSVKDVFVTVPAVRVVRKDFIDLADYNVDPTFTIDSTTGIQQAILDAYSTGIAKIRVPTGHYKIAGPRVGSGNCQLYIPQTREASPNKSIYFEGVSPPNFEQQGLRNVIPPTNGCIFESTLIGAGVGGVNPSVIGCEQGNSGDAWVWNYTNIGLKNMCIRTAVANSGTANAMSALNFQFSAQVAELDMLRIDVSRGLQDMVLPNTGSCGIIMPPVNNHLLLNGGMVYISGYNNAVIFQEHTHFRSLISIGNVNGIVLKNSYHGSWVGMYSAEWNKNAIVIDGDHDLSIGLYDAEHNSGANYTFVSDILYNAGARKVSIQHSLVVVSGSGINDSAFSTNATSANYKIVAGSGAN